VTRRDTSLESEAAEFLVLGQLLLRRIPAYKTYTRMPGYDLVATNPDTNRAARIQVKSRWASSASGFIIANFDSDFVVMVKLNRGHEKRAGGISEPEYFVFPTELIKRVRRTQNWSKAYFRHIPNYLDYKNAWDQVSEFLNAAA
jgi:hypothetical protein